MDQYFIVHPAFYDFLPVGAAVIINGAEWFIRATKLNTLSVESILRGSATNFKYETRDINHAEITQLKKRYDERNRIEMRLILNSLADKDERIKQLEASISALDARMQQLEARGGDNVETRDK